MLEEIGQNIIDLIRCIPGVDLTAIQQMVANETELLDSISLLPLVDNNQKIAMYVAG